LKFTQLSAYVKQNPAIVPIIIFIVLLGTAAALSTLGYPWAANEFAIYAFYALTAAVALQIAMMLREEKKGSRAANGSKEEPPNSS